MAKYARVGIHVVAAALSGLLVYAQYHPSDSVAVENGDALWMVVFSFGLLGVWLASGLLESWFSPSDSSRTFETSFAKTWVSLSLDWGPWILGGWMMIAAFGSCPPGNLRQSTNEAWFWLMAAAVVFVLRRLFRSVAARRAILCLVFGCAVAQSVHGLHQQIISLPQTRMKYEADPEGTLASVGIVAPEGSAERNVFENRLYDGGPTGTFALANSLAAVLIVGVVMGLSVVWLRMRSMKWPDRIAWTVVIAVLLAALVATRSRSALIAVMVGATVVFAGSIESKNRKVIGWIGGGALMAGLVVASVIAVFGRREWIEQAPASLAFRFQYWRSTLRMLFEYPLFGAGPGNFQSIYERFREPSASENIADPHHFFFETIGSGGWIAGGLLVLLIVAACVHFVKRLRQDGPDCNSGSIVRDETNLDQSIERSVWIGAGIGLALVWLVGIVTLQIPDLDAHTFAIPAALASIVLATPSLRLFSERDIDVLVSSVLVAVMVHLSIASGWTIPGVAILIWIFAAIATSTSLQVASQSSGTMPKLSRVRFAMLMAALVGIVLVWSMSLGPVRRETMALNAVRLEAERGRFHQADRFLREATNVDPWSDKAIRWQADLYHWELVRRPAEDTPGGDRSLRTDWQSFVEQAKTRSGENPATYRELGTAQLHVYQRFGDRDDLLAAMETIKQAAQWSPSDEWIAAQLAEIAREAGDEMLSQKMAQRAEWLSNLGNNTERLLDRQLILVAKRVGPPATNSIRQIPASELLANQLSRAPVAK
ncbi:O-Antigen ligase [Planctomycetes bacterium CA13]|uniref:O-Antigen ligase n=1 Tax=Novipirellula herctigrandis TaxID=2527986 RepID=A0A5C5Z6S6_9BACT|nr:O-Antigen ligase [Planctomycetes bacterium CA13]